MENLRSMATVHPKSQELFVIENKLDQRMERRLYELDLPKYVEWSFEIILRNKEKAREIYYLLTGFCGG